MIRLLTSGVARQTMDDFVTNLKRMHVSCVIDIRSPTQCRGAFSRKRTEAALRDAGIDHICAPKLLWTDDRYASANQARHANAYRRYAEQISASTALPELQNALGAVRSGGACIVSKSRDPGRDLRDGLAEQLSALSGIPVAISHLCGKELSF